jgi:dipeptidyl aminopeptidase/acylaminoacyl peptidase
LFVSTKPSCSVLLAVAATGLAIFAAGSAAANGSSQQAQAAAMAKVPLLPRELFFGDPERAAVRVSPDGKMLSWLAPRDGVLNLWVAPVGDPSAARPVTAEAKRPIQRYSWAPDSGSFLIMKDNNGDENFRLFLVPADGKPMRPLLEAKDAQVAIQAVSTRVLDRILVSINDRDPKWADLYSIDLATGARKLVLRNDREFAKYLFDDDLNVRLATHSSDDGGYDLYRIVNGAAEAKPYDHVDFEEMQTTRPISFSGDGKILYWSDSRGRDTAALFAEDVATGKRRLIAADDRADLSDTINDPVSGVPLAYGVNYLTNEYHPLGSAIAEDLRALSAKFGNGFAITSQSTDNKLWTVLTDTGDGPYEYWLYDRSGGGLKKLFVSRPDLAGKPLAKMRAREIKSRDGLNLVSYLTLPPGSDANADGVPDHPLPMVLLVHGGPWNRSEFGFDSTHQMLANRGYAVLDTNFRGSTGFGKKFVSAGDGEWGRKMQDDLIDAVDWAVAQHIAKPDKVAIMGSSYGGYATLAALTMTPDRFACGVDSAGPSDLQALLEAMPAQWESMRKQLYRRMGDPTTEAGRAWLKERSPLFYVDRITKPLLIGQGAKDPRVKASGPEKVVEVMTSHGIPVTYVLYSDEGHGLRRGPNRLSWSAISEQFLAQCLGGRAEPVGDAMKGSTAEIKTGAAQIAGLQPGR